MQNVEEIPISQVQIKTPKIHELHHILELKIRASRILPSVIPGWFWQKIEMKVNLIKTNSVSYLEYVKFWSRESRT